MLHAALDDFLKNQSETQQTISEKLSSKIALDCANGMAYISKKGYVHRDLAARNVLVKNSNHVKIADFGLAQLVSPSENQIEEFGGKMPLKWLAVECIEKGIYCHKRFGDSKKV